LHEEIEIMTTKRRTAKKSKARKAKAPGKRRSDQAALAVGTSSKKTTRERVAALLEAPLAVVQSDENLQALLKVLRDQKEPVKVRLAALQSLQAASFSVITFEPCRADYMATLREIIDDPDAELRQRALGILAREHDGYAQKRLLEGLEDKDKALVPPEKALQLLSYDVHAEAYPIARKIVETPPNDDAKREALRLLAADATAAPMFEKILRDKKEKREIRQVSASALQAVEPEKFKDYARELVLDTKEFDDIQATALTALTQMGSEAEVAKDEVLLKRVNRLGTSKSAKVKKGARKFLSRYGK
jgi:uncharacterized protein (UPF0147 family)